MPTFDEVLVTGNLTVQQNFRVNGSETIEQNLQVNGNQTVQQDLQVNNDQTVLGDFQVNGSQSVGGNLGVGESMSVGDNLSADGSVFAGERLAAITQAAVPPGAFAVSGVRYYANGTPGQPGLLLRGTDGLDYVLFVVVSGGVPALALQRA